MREGGRWSQKDVGSKVRVARKPPAECHSVQRQSPWRKPRTCGSELVQQGASRDHLGDVDDNQVRLGPVGDAIGKLKGSRMLT